MSEDRWDEIMEHYESPYNYGELQGATHFHQIKNELCGDSVRVQLQIQSGFVMQAWFQGDGCVVSQGSASLLMQAINGKPVSEVRQFTEGKWLERFSCVVTPRKRQCLLLAVRALQVVLCQQ